MLECLFSAVSKIVCEDFMYCSCSSAVSNFLSFPFFNFGFLIWKKEIWVRIFCFLLSFLFPLLCIFCLNTFLLGLCLIILFVARGLWIFGFCSISYIVFDNSAFCFAGKTVFECFVFHYSRVASAWSVSRFRFRWLLLRLFPEWFSELCLTFCFCCFQYLL